MFKTKKSNFLLFFSVLMAFLATIVGMEIYSKIVFQNKTKEFSFEKQITWLNPKYNKIKSKTIFILFHPDCEHCQSLALSISNNQRLFKNIQFLWVSYAPKSEINSFHKLYFSSNNMRFGFIAIEKLVLLFRDTSIPQIFIYDKNLALIKRFHGAIDYKELL